MLTLEGVTAAYGRVPVLHSVSLKVDEGQFVAIVGPNGAGKTTLFKTISGTVRASAGAIVFEGRDLMSVRAVPPGSSRHSPRAGGTPGVSLPDGH